jgi:DNA-binding NarL/FixJ family response regulator
MNKRTIFLADDHELVATGLASILKTIQSVDDVKVFPNGKELFKTCMHEKPSHIFLDIEMPEWDGLYTLKELKKSYPSIPVLMLSMLNERHIIEDCIDNGALAYLNKDSTLSELEEALKSVENQVKFYSSEVKKALDGKLAARSTSNLELTEPLTDRELEVLNYLCDGLTSKEIGEKLFLSSRTVETHKNNIMQKFGVNTTGKLIMLAIKNRIVK